MGEIFNPELNKTNPEARKAVSESLQNLFDVLKEHASSLTERDIENLSRQFTNEVDDYIEGLIIRIKNSRGQRKV